MMLAVLALFAGPAEAGPGLAACCQAVGGGACPDTLKITGSATA